MPFEITFSARQEVKTLIDLAEVADRLWPALEAHYGTPTRTFRGDRVTWAAFADGRVGLIVKVAYGEAPGGFRIGLASWVRRWWVLRRIVDTPELEALERRVFNELASWAGPDVDPDELRARTRKLVLH